MRPDVVPFREQRHDDLARLWQNVLGRLEIAQERLSAANDDGRNQDNDQRLNLRAAAADADSAAEPAGRGLLLAVEFGNLVAERLVHSNRPLHATARPAVSLRPWSMLALTCRILAMKS